MRVFKQNPWLPSLGVLLAAMTIAGYARADVTTDEAGSIVIFPKVIADASRDTLIQLSNTSNSRQYVTCFYVDTSTASPGTCSGSNPPNQDCSVDGDAACFATDNGFCVRCNVENYPIQLTPQQPTVWRVSAGRRDTDMTAGFFFGNIPGHPLFRGEIKCFQTDADGAPTGGNALKGEATIETLSSGQISEYNGIAIKAIGTPPSPICVGGDFPGKTCTKDSDCTGATSGTCNLTSSLDNTVYNACPRQLLVNHYGGGAEDPATGATVTSELTLVPCSEALETGAPTTTSVTFNAYNEYEQPISKIVPFTCWLNITIGDILTGDPRITPGLDVKTLGTDFAKTRVFTSTGDQKTCAGGSNAGNFCAGVADCPNSTCTGPPASGILGVLEEFHAISDNPVGTAAVNLHVTNSPDRLVDTITQPAVTP